MKKHKKANKILKLTNKLANFILAGKVSGEIPKKVADELLHNIHDLEEKEVKLLKGLTDIEHFHI